MASHSGALGMRHTTPLNSCQSLGGDFSHWPGPSVVVRCTRRGGPSSELNQSLARRRVLCGGNQYCPPRSAICAWHSTVKYPNYLSPVEHWLGAPVSLSVSHPPCPCVFLLYRSSQGDGEGRGGGGGGGGGGEGGAGRT